VTHAAGDGKPGPHGTLLRVADKPVLGFTDNGAGDVVCMPFFNKVENPCHLVLFITKDPSYDSTGKCDSGLFQRVHCSEHGGKVSFGIVGSPAVHPSIDDFCAKGIVSP